MMEKSLILIDGENVFRSWWNYCKENELNDNIDYLKLIKELSGGTNLLRAIFYDGVPEIIPTKKKNFHSALQHNGIQLRTKILKNRTHTCSNCNKKDIRQVQKGVDVSLATDILRHAWQKSCDVCIVVSGDEDYKDAIECAKEKGIKIWVASFKKSLSSDLRKVADKTIILDDLFHQIKKDAIQEPKDLNMALHS